MKRSLGAKTLVFPTPTWVIGSYDAAGKPNVMTVAWGGICCSKPPCVSIALRAATYTYASLKQRQAFTVNIPSEKYIQAADYFGLVSGREQDKFAASGLTPVRSELVDAPYVGEFPLVLECRVIHTLEIGLHTLFVGEIMDVKAEEEVLDPAGVADITRVKPPIFAPETRAYFGVGARLGSAFDMGKEIK